MADDRDDLVVFTHLLRRSGVDVSTQQTLAWVEAVAALGVVDEVDLYWSGLTTLVSHPDDRSTYDAVFRLWFLADAPVHASVETEAPRPQPGDASSGGGEDAVGLVATERETLRSRRFDEATEAELRAIATLMRSMEVRLPIRRSRRTRPHRRGRQHDLRRSMRAAVQTDGELLRQLRRRRGTTRRGLVLVLDVSGSMAGFSRALLQFAFSARVAAGHVEVHCFGTRLTRVTDALDHHDVDAAVQAAAARVVDWDGGTRIGASLDELVRTAGPRGTLRGAVVVICSDGLDRGDPDDVRRAMERLHRYAHHVVWVNPLRADPRYEPLARGMAAALPSVDTFVSGHDLASLDELASMLEVIG